MGKVPGEPPLQIDGLWNLAVRTAENDPLVRHQETANPTLPTLSPLSLAELGQDGFALDGAIQAVRDASSFG